MQMKQKAFVFTMDAAYAVFIILLATATVMMVLQTTQQSNEDILYLSRLAADINIVEEATGETVNMDWIKINDCAEAETVGTNQAVIYAGNGNVQLNITEVCLP